MDSPDAASRRTPPAAGVLTSARHFLTTALLHPATHLHREKPASMRRRQLVVALFLIMGAIMVVWMLSIRPGDSLFYPAAFALATIRVIGAFAAGPLHLGHHRTVTGTLRRPYLQAVVVGLLLLGIFLAGTFIIVHIPLLRDPLEALLNYARHGWLPLVVALTIYNAVAEELFFRGALYAAIPRPAYAVSVSTVLYTMTVVGSGVALLVFAAGVLGFVTALQRRATGGILAPVITHITWTTGMLLLLPPTLQFVR